MNQSQTSKDNFARSLIGLSIGIVALLGGVLVLFQNFYTTPEPSLSSTPAKLDTISTTNPSPVEAAPLTVTKPLDTGVPPVLLSLEDKKVMSADDTITMPAPAKPRATLVSDVETGTPSVEATTAATDSATPPASTTTAAMPPIPAAEKAATENTHHTKPVNKATEEDAPSSKTVATTKPSTKTTELKDDKEKKDKVALTSSQAESNKTGWIYAGQFTDGKWQAKGLVIGDELPSAGHSYALNWGANIRATPPGKAQASDKQRENVGYLAQGRKVEIVQIKQSGNKGHIWLQIKR